MIEVLGGFKARIIFGETHGQSQLGPFTSHTWGQGIWSRGTNKQEAETSGVKTEMCVGGGGWARGHDLRVGVKRGLK